MGWDIPNVRVWFTALKAHNCVCGRVLVLHAQLWIKRIICWAVRKAEVVEKSCSAPDLIVSLMEYIKWCAKGWSLLRKAQPVGKILEKLFSFLLSELLSMFPKCTRWNLKLKSGKEILCLDFVYSWYFPRTLNMIWFGPWPVLKTKPFLLDFFFFK